jgi:hypothetical protein
MGKHHKWGLGALLIGIVIGGAGLYWYSNRSSGSSSST